ncbi:MAG TPA: glycosyltransferase family 4 protein [Hydrogenophaga sp.]|nr:glycosyltransferase family 4 protein [Hydrogenophaga sp.]
MQVAYLINQYPKVSHSFIRREILALERQGFGVVRLALRGWNDTLVDPEDIEERKKTRYLLRRGVAGLVPAVFRRLFKAPRALFRGLVMAIRMARQADRSLPYHLIYLAEACELIRILEDTSVRHVHAHFGTNSAEVAMLAHTLGGPTYSFTAHGSAEFDCPRGIHLTEKIENAAFVVAISSFGRSQLFRWVRHEHWHKVKVVHCGLESGFHTGSHIDTSIFPEEPRFVCIGRLCETKGQLLLLDAVRELKERGKRLHLVLAGDGEMRPVLEKHIALHGLQDMVSITGWISSAQVRQELLAAKAMVLPSFSEGLPVVVMEAMALGRPVLTTSIAGIPELVRHGTDGWLITAGDVDALVKALGDVLALSTQQLETMGLSAKVRVIERHSIDTEAAKLAELFRATG